MTAQSAEFLRSVQKSAIRQGFCRIANTKPRPELEPPARVDPMVIKSLRRARRLAPIPETLQINEPARDTVAQRYQDSRCQSWSPRTFLLAPLEAIELARFRVERGAVGVVKGIWTHVEVNSEIKLEPGNPGNPICDPLIFARSEIPISWHLRLYRKDPRFEPQWWRGLLPDMPGEPFRDLPYWLEYRYPWGMFSDAFFLVPGGCDLRLILYGGPEAESLTNARGRLWGYTQPHMKIATMQNMRHGWNW